MMRVAKNTMYLYIRMLLSLVIALYTSRVALDVLGSEDYGLYAVVGGIVGMFSFFNSAMSVATLRFFAFEIGKKNLKRLQKTFSATLNIHLAIALLILVLAETIGLWFVNTKLNYPLEKTEAVFWVYQFSICTFIIGVVKVPFNALIIANERMKAYAYFSIIEVISKLTAVFFLITIDTNKLVLYALLIFVLAVIITVVFIIYCYKNFKECRYERYYDKNLNKQLLTYSGWNLFGNIAAVAKNQGSNVLLNLFYGPIINASYGIAIQVHSATSLFVTNFQTAINPQIIKKYASKEYGSMLDLIMRSSKFSFILMLILITPLLIETRYVLKVWLTDTPQYTVEFTFLVTINLLIDSLSGPFMSGAQATGKIKYYQIVIGTLLFLNLPISYLFLLNSYEPTIVFTISIVISILAVFARLVFLQKLISFPILKYLNEVLLRLVPVTVLCIFFSYISGYYMSEGMLRLIVVTLSSLFAGTGATLLFGIDSFERKIINEKLRAILS